MVSGGLQALVTGLNRAASSECWKLPLDSVRPCSQTTIVRVDRQIRQEAGTLAATAGKGGQRPEEARNFLRTPKRGHLADEPELAARSHTAYGKLLGDRALLTLRLGQVEHVSPHSIAFQRACSVGGKPWRMPGDKITAGAQVRDL
jgi:hypothetical protein